MLKSKLPNPYTLESAIAGVISRSKPGHIKKMGRLKKEFKMLQKKGKTRLIKTYSSVVKKHVCSLNLPKAARDYISYN